MLARGLRLPRMRLHTRNGIEKLHMSMPLKVWFPTLKSGTGADVFVTRLVDGLLRHGVDASITWFSTSAELLPWLMASTPPPDGTHVIHANAANAFVFSKWRLPLVATEHHFLGDPDYRRYKTLSQATYHWLLMSRYVRMSFRAATVVTVGSEFTAGILRRHAGVEPVLVRYWVDGAHFSPGADARDPSRPFRFLSVGNLSRRKGGDVLIEVARRLRGVCEVRATGGLRNEAPQGSDVVMLGKLSDAELLAEFRACDAMLLPSRYEGFGYAAAEGMACGKPVVGFRNGAFEELIHHGEHGLLADVDDVDELVRHCRTLLGTRNLAQTMGASARQRVLLRHQEAPAVEAYIQLYRRLSDPSVFVDKNVGRLDVDGVAGP